LCRYCIQCCFFSWTFTFSFFCARLLANAGTFKYLHISIPLIFFAASRGNIWQIEQVYTLSCACVVVLRIKFTLGLNLNLNLSDDTPFTPSSRHRANVKQPSSRHSASIEQTSSRHPASIEQTSNGHRANVEQTSS